VTQIAIVMLETLYSIVMHIINDVIIITLSLSLLAKLADLIV